MNPTSDSPIANLHANLNGNVIAPDDPGYDDARRVFFTGFDRRPAAIVRVADASDVSRTVNLARETGAELAVRSGGHSRAGFGTSEGGIVLDLSEMNAVDIDPEGRTAWAQTGITAGDYTKAAGKHGLATGLGDTASVGVGGITLGGGIGFLVRKHGLTIDDVLGAEVVTADGELLKVDEDTHPDLFWALRGGGGNFGIATSFTYRLHPVRTIRGGLIAHPIDAAPDLLRYYRDAVTDASDDLTVFAGLMHAPDGSGAKLAALVVFHSGDAGEAERELKPFKTWGSPLMVDVGPMPYPVMNTILDAGFPAGSLNHWLSSFTRGLPDELIDIAVERFASVPSPMSAILLEHFHGAVTRVGATETAVPHRDEGWNLLIASVWTDPPESEANIAWSRETFAAMRPHFGTGRWLNYLGDDQAEGAIRAAYGANYQRLREVKRRYDPDNVFHLNHNIVP